MWIQCKKGEKTRKFKTRKDTSTWAVLNEPVWKKKKNVFQEVGVVMMICGCGFINCVARALWIAAEACTGGARGNASTSLNLLAVLHAARAEYKGFRYRGLTSESCGVSFVKLIVFPECVWLLFLRSSSSCPCWTKVMSINAVVCF